LGFNIQCIRKSQSCSSAPAQGGFISIKIQVGVGRCALYSTEVSTSVMASGICAESDVKNVLSLPDTLITTETNIGIQNSSEEADTTSEYVEVLPQTRLITAVVHEDDREALPVSFECRLEEPTTTEW